MEEYDEISHEQSEGLEEVHEEAMSDFDKAQTPVADEREQCLEDRRFYSISGAQWEGKLGDQFENKPQYEINKVHLSVMRIINDYRNNRITVDFVSDTNEKIADTCDKLYRADEQDSIADEAYDNAFEEAVGGGFGAWRLKADYEDHEDDENEYQRIQMLPIYDADSSVFFDPNAKRQDKSDANYCFVLNSMSKEAYEDEYGEFDSSSVGKTISQSEFDWNPDDSIYVAEYYKCEYIRTTINIFEDIQGNEFRYSSEDLKDDPELYEQLLATGHKLVRTKKVKKRKIRKFIIDGARVLEDCGYIAGKHIPIVPVYGKRWFVDNVERCMGHVRLVKDAQRLKNMQISKLAEFSASSTMSKPIVTPEQIAGHETIWKDDNVKNYPYLLINPITDANGNEQAVGPVGQTTPPSLPPAMAALLQLTDQDIRDLTGNQEMGEQLRANLSGDLMEMIQNKLDMQTYIYMSNMAKAMRRCGEIWLSMAKDIMVEENRKVKGVSKSGAIEYLEISKPTLNKDTNEVEYLNDVSKAKLDIRVSVSPSTTTKKAKTVRDLSKMLPMVSDPELQQVLSSTAVLNMEGEGLEDIKSFIRRKLVRMGAVKPDEKEMQELQQEMQNIQPNAQDTYLQAEATKAQVQAQKYAADTAKVMAETEKTKAQTLETMVGLKTKGQASAIASAEKLNNMMKPQQQGVENGRMGL